MSGLLGFATAFTAFIGYGLALLLLLSAIAKIIDPAETGMWVGQGHFHIGQMRGPHPGVRDVLGLWAIPLFTLLGLSFYVLTNFVVRWLIRHRENTTPLKQR